MAAARTSYDEVPYDSQPRRAAHPDVLATLATLLGLSPAPPDRCRVLELGCASGGHLLPLAEAYPDSRFVGIDLSASQIDAGRRVVAALGVDNLRLEACGIQDVDESFGRFDYVIAHGVYSWVPAEVRDRLLRVCKHALAENGVAYVSYNTYPGWHLRAAVREILRYHTRGLDEPAQRIGQARAMLEFLAGAVPNADGAWARLLRDEAEMMRPHGDHYVFHEHLEGENHPVYFHEFIAHVGRHGLQYLGEAEDHLTLEVYPPEVRAALQGLSENLLQLEQYLDFLKSRMFRRTLLVHERIALQRAPGPGIVEGLAASALAAPASSCPDIASTATEGFHNGKGGAVSTDVPLIKAALVVLFEARPRPVPFADLVTHTCQRLGPGTMGPDQARALLGRSLVHLYLSNLVALHVRLPDIVTTVSDRPRSTPLLRWQARTGAVVTNRRHLPIEVGGLDRAVLGLLDGRRDREALLQGLAEAVLAGELGLNRDGQPVTDAATARATLAPELDACLTRLARAAVLVE